MTTKIEQTVAATNKGAPSTGQQNILVYDRKKFRVSGVTDITLFTETEIMLETSLGTLLVTGNNLKMGSLDANKHETEIKGEFNSCEYLKDRRAFKSGKRKKRH